MSKFLSKNWPLVGIAVLILVIGFYLRGSGKVVVRKPVPPDGSQTGIKLEDIRFSHESPDEGLRWTLDAKEVRISEDRQQFSFTAFQLTLEPPGRSVVHLEGNSGQLDESAGRILLSGDVRGRTEDGYTIATERAVFDQRLGRLVTEEPVTITGPLLSLKGRGLSYTVSEETLRIHSEVTTLIKSESLKS